MYKYITYHSYVQFLVGDAAAQAAFALKPCVYVNNLPLDQVLNLSYMPDNLTSLSMSCTVSCCCDSFLYNVDAICSSSFLNLYRNESLCSRYWVSVHITMKFWVSALSSHLCTSSILNNPINNQPAKKKKLGFDYQKILGIVEGLFIIISTRATTH